MVNVTLKLRLTRAEERTLETWLWHLTGVYNWAIRKIELDAKDGIYHSAFDLKGMLAHHASRMEIPSHVLREMAVSAHDSWQRCFRRGAKKPKLKGNRNRLNFIPFPDPVRPVSANRVSLPGIGRVKYHKQELPQGPIKRARVLKRASGWYVMLTVDAPVQPIPAKGICAVGIDPGFNHLVTLSSGEKVDHPRELEANALRVAQSQRSGNRRQTARLHEREANRRKDRNHKLSHRLVAENQVIAFSKDNIKGIGRTAGKSVRSSSHYQLRSMLAYKCRAGGRQYVEVPSRNSTKTCSACGSLSGPTGYAGLKVRQWQCDACGADHDRDINAAINTLIVGLGLSHERYREIASENLDSVGGSLLQILSDKSA